MTTARSGDIENSFWYGIETIAVGARYRRALIAAASSVSAELVKALPDRRIAVDERYGGNRHPF